MAVHRAKIRALTAEIRGDGWFDFFLKNTPNILKGPMLGSMHGAFEGVPAVICSAGPSLNKQLEQLKEIQGQVVILCVNTAIGALDRAGLQPHAVVAVESANLESMFEKISFIRELNAIFDLTGNPRHFELPFRRMSTFSTENTTCARFLYELDPRGALSGGFCVANTAFAIAHKMGCNPIMLVGQDLAYSGGKVYAQGTVFEGLRSEIKDGKSIVRDDGSKSRILKSSKDALTATSSGDMTSERVVTTGWGGEGEVESTNDFLMFRDWFSRTAVQMRDRGVECVNCTEGGLTIPEWAEIPFREAIGRYVTPRTSSEPPIRQRFDDLMDQAGTETGQVIALLEREAAHIEHLRGLSARAQVLVNFDPEGDLRAPEQAQLELAEIQQQLAEVMEQAHLTADALSRPFESLHLRRELNLFAIHRSIEETLEPLADRIAGLLAEVRAMDQHSDPS